MSKTYKVRFPFHTFFELEIEAESEDEAIELAKTKVAVGKVASHWQ